MNTSLQLHIVITIEPIVEDCRKYGCGTFENIEETISYRYIKVRTKLDHSLIQISTGLGDLYGSIQLYYVSLFGVFGTYENFSLIWKRHHCRRRTANFDLCSALMGIGQGGFFSVAHLL